MSIPHWRLKDRYYRLLGSKCSDCGSEFFPPVYVCRRCGSEHIEDREMPRSGVILTYTILREEMAGFENQMPLTFAIVKLENGVKVLGQVVDSQAEQVEIDARVKHVFRKVKDEDGEPILYGYKFQVI